VSRDVCVEPPLQPLTGESLSFSTANTEAGARLDVKARGFWGLRQQEAYFDVRVFHPNAASYRSLQLDSCYKRHEREKRRVYLLVCVIFCCTIVHHRGGCCSSALHSSTNKQTRDHRQLLLCVMGWEYIARRI